MVVVSFLGVIISLALSSVQSYSSSHLCYEELRGGVVPLEVKY